MRRDTNERERDERERKRRDIYYKILMYSYIR